MNPFISEESNNDSKKGDRIDRLLSFIEKQERSLEEEKRKTQLESQIRQVITSIIIPEINSIKSEMRKIWIEIDRIPRKIDFSNRPEERSKKKVKAENDSPDLPKDTVKDDIKKGI